MFFKKLKHWYILRTNTAKWQPIHDWAERRGAQFRPALDGRGFLIEQPNALPGGLRIEWGLSHRSYIRGNELRMRCELQLHSDLQMMVLCHQLVETLERAVFAAYTESMKTRVDTDTPEEMRWLVTFHRLKSISSKLVRQRFDVVGFDKELTQAWVDGELNEQFSQASQEFLPLGTPFVLMTMRGNVYLRMAMSEVTLPKIQALLRLLELACKEALHVDAMLADRHQVQ